MADCNSLLHQHCCHWKSTATMLINERVTQRAQLLKPSQPTIGSGKTRLRTRVEVHRLYKSVQVHEDNERAELTASEINPQPMCLERAVSRDHIFCVACVNRTAAIKYGLQPVQQLTSESR
jgi:hypothetical protein